jgi:cytochrome b561
LTKFFSWFVVILFASRFASANIMLRIDADETALGQRLASIRPPTIIGHKSIALLALAGAVLRLEARRRGQLHPNANLRSNRAIFYSAMFVMPVSGFLYVMAGGYGVNLFRVPDLANPIEEHASLAIAAKWTHIISSYALGHLPDGGQDQPANQEKR